MSDPAVDAFVGRRLLDVATMRDGYLPDLRGTVFRFVDEDLFLAAVPDHGRFLIAYQQRLTFPVPASPPSAAPGNKRNAAWAEGDGAALRTGCCARHALSMRWIFRTGASRGPSPRRATDLGRWECFHPAQRTFHDTRCADAISEWAWSRYPDAAEASATSDISPIHDSIAAVAFGWPGCLAYAICE